MYYRGLQRFMEYKHLKPKECIGKFLESQKVDFSHRNHRKVNKYISENWNRFATFVDKGLKSGELKGKDIKLNHYYDERKERKEMVNREYDNISDEVKDFFKVIKKHDDPMRLSKCSSFLGKKGYNLPRNDEGVSLIKRVLPKLEYMIDSGYKDEIIEHIKNN